VPAQLTAGDCGGLRGYFDLISLRNFFFARFGAEIPPQSPAYPRKIERWCIQRMTQNGMTELIEAVRRRHLEAQGRAPEPPPAPEPAGWSDLLPAVREAVQPFLERFRVTKVTLCCRRGNQDAGFPTATGSAGNPLCAACARVRQSPRSGSFLSAG
jgi:hypothetical protein